MLLRTRIMLLMLLAFAMVAAAIGGPAWLLFQERGERISRLISERQGVELRRAIDHADLMMQRAARLFETEESLRADLQSLDAEALEKRLRDLMAGDARFADIRRIDLIVQDERILVSVPEGRGARPVIVNRNVLRSVGAEASLVGIDLNPDTRLPLIFHARRIGPVLLVLGASFEPSLGNIIKNIGAVGGGILGSDGRPLLLSDAGMSELLAAAGSLDRLEAERFRRNGSYVELVQTELRGLAGLPTASLFILQDVSTETRREVLTAMKALFFLVLIMAGTCLVLYRTIRSTLDPLTDLSNTLRSVAEGDIFASAPVLRRTDEVGEIANALELVRDSALTLDRMKIHERISVKHHQALIGAELSTLSKVLEEREHAQAMRLLDRMRESPEASGAVLAESFQHMAASVMRRHERLATLLEERTKDLETVRAALHERVQLNRLKEELEVARNLQLSSLPSVFPTHEAFMVSADLIPAKEVGGDFFDVFMLDQERLAVFIGDASGKGVGAAMVVAVARSLLKSCILRGLSPDEAMGQANAVLSVDNPTMMFTTAFVGVFNLTTGAFVFSNAGHNAPILRKADGSVVWISEENNIALGILEDHEFIPGSVTIKEGDTLLLYTDGVTEAVDGPGGFYGEQRLENLVRNATRADPAALIRLVIEDVERFSQGEPQADDITMLCLYVQQGSQEVTAEGRRLLGAA